ncbi:MAG TPA: phosphoenolpyruvate--protein phosphotransferase [Puia sp.]|nr:phosphoenolpyruvate--protein phosphotransferase [Puia sp.]
MSNPVINKINGIKVSPGIAIGRAYLLEKSNQQITGVMLIGPEQVEQEILKFENAVKDSIEEVEVIMSTLTTHTASHEILNVQIELLQDEQIKTDVWEMILSQHKNANDSVIEVIEASIIVLKNLENDYLSARAADIKDAGNRILKHLNNEKPSGAKMQGEDVIIIAEDITPSEVVTMDLSKVSGFATQVGGKTSHAAIVAKSRGIPAVVGCGTELAGIQTNDLIIVDGENGEIIVQPGPDVLNHYIEKKNDFLKKTTLLNDLKDAKAITTDGVEITLLANISNATDMEASFAFGSEGCGLLRTEVLFMNRTSFPNEEEQFEFYKEIALKAKGKPVIVRTLDIGGDKKLPYFDLPQEQNPFLGYRAIRICLRQKDIFKTQLAAILRASVFGDLKIMLPMISNILEIREAKMILQEVKTELAALQIKFNEDIQLGIMVEIPSAAVTADLLAKEIDFFSIGTNDLCQYTLAVDRLNEQVKHLYEPFNPGVLRLIQNVIEQGNKQNIHTGMCGELAGDPSAILLLLGMGLREFSMSAPAIPYVKNLINNTSIVKAREIHQHVMTLDSAETIIHYLRESNTQ